MSREARDAAAGRPPYGLLWSAAIVAVTLSIAAFALWAIGGTGILFDMVVALCV